MLAILSSSVLFLILYGFFISEPSLFPNVQLFVTNCGYYVFAIFGCWYCAKTVVNLFIKYILPRVTPKDKCVFVTGCDTGFGNLIAKSLSKKGFHVFAGCLFPDGDGAHELSEMSNITVLPLDVTKDEDAARCFEIVQNHVQETGQGLWGLVNNAGVGSASFLEWDSMDSFRRVFKVNAEGQLRMMRTMAPLIKKSQGRMVNIGSIGSRLGFPALGAYATSKVAVRTITETIRGEMSIFGVKVVLVEPHAYSTSLTDYGNMANMVKASWDRTDENVRNGYDADMFKFVSLIFNMMAFFSQFIDLGRSTNFNEVVDAVEEGLMSYEPESLYQPSQLYMKPFIYVLFNFIPTEFIDLTATFYLKYLKYGGKLFSAVRRYVKNNYDLDIDFASQRHLQASAVHSFCLSSGNKWAALDKQ
ncbi:17-beta-hydroxysteroid dehydrogenase type 6 [Halotydeus destructor]|nr:17-beta-hydroxysteroid dehydrogenase type 6 [Halotydeus destructor]